MNMKQAVMNAGENELLLKSASKEIKTALIENFILGFIFFKSFSKVVVIFFASFTNSVESL